MWYGICLMLTGTLLCTAILAAHAEVVRRVNPDGSITEYVPSAGPPQGTPQAPTPQSPCANKPWEPGNVYHARETYHAALAKLKNAPTDPECRQQALYFGRLYSAFSRRDGRVTIYDEAAMANDINAAAGSVVTPAPR